MLHIFKYVLSDYIEDDDKRLLLQSDQIQDFTLPLDILNISIHFDKDFALTYASKHGNLEVIKFLIRRGADIHSQYDGPFRYASYNGQLPVVKYLLEEGSDIHALDDYAFRYSSYNGHFSTAEFLVEKGANIHAYENDSIITAIVNNHEFLVEKGANIDCALIAASSHNNLHLVIYLISKGANIHYLNDRSIHLAKMYGNTSVVNYLETLISDNR